MAVVSFPIFLTFCLSLRNIAAAFIYRPDLPSNITISPPASNPLHSHGILSILPRTLSQDPSCPAGFLCEQSECPADIECESGEICVNFEGTVVCAQAGLQFCALNPTTLEGVGCDGGLCCHGNCYATDAVCCDNPSIQCSIGTLCNACSPGQSCGDNVCINPISTASSPVVSIPSQTSFKTTAKTSAVTPLSTSPSAVALPQTSPSTASPTLSIGLTTAAPTTTKASSGIVSSQITSTLPVTTGAIIISTIVPTAGNFSNPSCLVDSPSSRLLVSGSSSLSGSGGMTVEKCADLAAGFQYAGVEFSEQCFWGNVLQTPTSASLDDCSMACDGDTTEICGGSNRILLYRDSSFVDSSLAPQTVPAIGSFQSQGCFFDSPTSRLLANGSSSDPDMTVETCVGLARGWRFAGVEFGIQCFWGDILIGASASVASNCNMPCAGNNLEVCGASNRISLYEDTTWFLPTNANLTDSLSTLSSLALQIQTAVSIWSSEVSVFAAATSTSGLQARATHGAQKRDILDAIAASRALALLLEGRWEEAAQGFVTWVITALHNAVPRVTETVVNESMEMVSMGDTAKVLIESSATASPLEDLAITEEAAAIIGFPELGADAILASGLFHIFKALLNFLAEPAPPGLTLTAIPSNTATNFPSMASSASQTQTSSASCIPTATPTPIVVLTTDTATRAEYDTLTAQLEKSGLIITDEILFDDINFRALLVDLDDCDVANLLNNPIVETVVANAEVDAVDDFSDDNGDSFVKRQAHKLEDRNRRRSIPTDSSLAMENFDDLVAPLNGSPFHLNWLSSIWAKNKLAAGKYYSFENYVYDTEDANAVQIFVLDSGVDESHLEFTGRMQIGFSAVTDDPLTVQTMGDSTGHGTAMCSLVAGLVCGVDKGVQTQIVPIQVGATGTVFKFLRGFAFVFRAAQPNLSVISMSFSVNTTDLKTPGGRPLLVDPFLPMINRAKEFGIVTVASAGNRGNAQALNVTTPRRLGGTNSPLIVVGACDQNGQQAAFSQSLDPANQGILTAYANGVNVLVAKLATTNGYRIMSGTSPATAITAGLISTYLARGFTTAAGAKQFLIDTANSRKGPWRDGIPRVATDIELTCDGPAVPLTLPTYGVLASVSVTTLLNDGELLNAIPADSLPPCVSVSPRPPNILPLA